MRTAKFKKGDKVKLLYGGNIPNYSGLWMPSMNDYVGNETTIRAVQYDRYTNSFRYMVEDNLYMWDERSIESLEPKPNWKVLITPIDNENTEGKLLEGNKIIKTVATKKSKDDEYSMEEACKVIIERLFEEPKVETFPDGTIVEITDETAYKYQLPRGLRGKVVKYLEYVQSYVIDFGMSYHYTHDCCCLPDKTGLLLESTYFTKVDA